MFLGSSRVCFSSELLERTHACVVVFPSPRGRCSVVVSLQMWELHARHHYSHRKEPTEDEKALNRAMGGAYNKTVLWREQGVRQNLPPNVLASKDYVDQ